MRNVSAMAALARSMLVGLGLAALPLAGQAEAPPRHDQAPGFYRMMLGDAEITALLDGTHTFPIPTTLQAPGQPPGGGPRRLLEEAKPGEAAALLASARSGLPFEGSINAFLVNSGGRLTLIDTGAGELYGACCGRLAGNLRAAGYRPEQVDDILITHLHLDHFGGLMAAGQPVYPNATVHISKIDLDYWLDPAKEAAAPAFLHPMFEGARKVLKPYLDAGRVRGFAAGEVLPGITAVATPGHTPGHSSYLIESRGQKMLVWGDIVHVAPIQLPEPAVTVTYDSAADSAEATRKTLFDQAAAKDGFQIAAAHISFPGLGHIVRRDGWFIWLPANYTTELSRSP